MAIKFVLVEIVQVETVLVGDPLHIANEIRKAYNVHLNIVCQTLNDLYM
jgi:hypothetical protein